MLAPTSPRGWFGGQALLAWDAEVRRVEGAEAIAQAGTALDAAFAGDAPPTAVLLGYEGGATIAAFSQVTAHDASALQRAIALRSAAPPATPLLDAPRSDLGHAEYVARVEEVRERIASGDVYVLNLTRRIVGRPVLGPVESFASLFERGGAEMSALLSCGGATIASVSPERFVSVVAEGDRRAASICPIKGTRPRSDDPLVDARLAAELAADAKERAEHLMVVDLERNDLGRVCKPGSVRVDPLYEVVGTPYCHQLVSCVRGDLRPDATFGELLDAAFPCGSVTGAPKVAAVRIAEQLEASARGAYCGALLVALPGRLDSSVLIRTLEFAEDGTAAWGTGCGITFESDAEAEWAESELKALPILPSVNERTERDSKATGRAL